MRSRSRILILAAAAGLSLAVIPAAGAGPTPAPAVTPWCPEPEARQFDFWLGEWDVVNLNSPGGSDAWVETGTATDRVYAVVGGCGVVEHWRGKAFPPAIDIDGFSVRAWNPASREWELALLWPIGQPASFGTPAGRFEGGRGEFTNRLVDPQGRTIRTRLAFHDITDSSFQWNNGFSTDGGMTWDSSWIMEFTRRPATASGLLNGPSMRADRCAGGEHRAFDGWLGEWDGVRETAAGASAPVRVHLLRILGGCGIMERATATDGSWESFAVRAYQPDAGHWIEYALSSDRRALHRREDAREGDVVFEDVAEAGETRRRTRWTVAEDRLTWTEEERAGDGPWRRVAVTRLSRPGSGGP